MEERYLIYKPMEQLKKEIADTVFLPTHLRDWKERQEIKDLAYHLVFEILNLYYLGVESSFLDNKKIKKTCRKIDDLNYELAEISTPQVNLQNWLWIGETIEMWIEFSLESEEYEVATNLRKLLNSEYV